MSPEEKQAFFASFKSVKPNAKKIAEDENKNLRFAICGDHPHSGKQGTLGVVDGNISTIQLFGKTMYAIKFDPDIAEHQDQGCFAEKKNLKPIYEANK